MIHTVKGSSIVNKAEVDIFLEFPCFFYDPTCMYTQSCPILCNLMDCIARQTPLSMEFSRQEYWSGLLCPQPGDLPNPGVEPRSPVLQADPLLLSHQGSPTDTLCCVVLSRLAVSLSATPWTVVCQVPGDSPGKDAGVGCHTLLQGIFPTQGLKPGLPHCRWIFYQLS